MDLADALQRRVIRLALLLTADPSRAADALSLILAANPDIRRIAESRIDRMVIQHARGELAGPAPANQPDITLDHILTLSDPARRLWDAAARLEQQPREAWILRDLEQMDEIPTARAMDCSRTAIETVHRPHALNHLQAALADDYSHALASLHEALDALDPAPLIAIALTARAAAQRRRRITTFLLLFVLLFCFGVLTYILFDLLAWENEHQIDPNAFTQPAPGAVRPGPMNAPDSFPTQPR